MVKVLLVTCVHPNELNTKQVCEAVKKRMGDCYSIHIYAMPTTRFSEREISLNLNRETDINSLLELADSIKELKSIASNYDLVLDVHNSPDIMNCVLATNIADGERFEISRSYNSHDVVAWCETYVITRQTQFLPISGMLRRDCNVKAYTAEISKMERNVINEDDVDFLISAIINLSEVSEKRTIDIVDRESLDWYEPKLPVLRTIVLKHEIDVSAGERIRLVPSQIETIDGESPYKFINSEFVTVRNVGSWSVDGKTGTECYFCE